MLSPPCAPLHALPSMLSFRIRDTEVLQLLSTGPGSPHTFTEVCLTSSAPKSILYTHSSSSPSLSPSLPIGFWGSGTFPFMGNGFLHWSLISQATMKASPAISLYLFSSPAARPSWSGRQWNHRHIHEPQKPWCKVEVKYELMIWGWEQTISTSLGCSESPRISLYSGKFWQTCRTVFMGCPVCWLRHWHIQHCCFKVLSVDLTVTEWGLTDSV